MAEQLEEAVKLLLLLSHRAATFDSAGLNRRVDGLVDSYLAGFGNETASKREQLAKAFSEKAPATTTSDRIRARIERKDA